MTSKFEYKPKCVKIHDLEAFSGLLKGVKVAACMLTEPQQVVDEQSVIKRVSALTLGGPSSGDQCSCCGAGPFASRAEQTAHYKHHWHTYNLKRRLFGKSALSLPQFTSRQDDNSSVSGSDSETEGNSSSPSGDLFAAATRHCKAFYTNQKGQVFCVYRCVLHHRKEDLSTDGDGTAWVDRVSALTKPGSQRWAVLMVSGGHFAGCVFADGSPVVHKSQHSYLVRRGQGQAQGARDQHGSAPRSAGASLRRYNQQAFQQHIQDILSSWGGELAECALIFHRAVGPVNQRALFGPDSPVKRDDPRVRVLPFPTRKPTFKEVQRAFATLSQVELYDTMEQFQRALIASSAKPSTKPRVDAERAGRKTTKSSPVKLDRAKSRELIPRPLPTEVTSSEDEGPCFIDSETPVGWIKTLSEQSSNGVITNSRKDLLNNDYSVEESSEGEQGVEKKRVKKKKKKKEEKEVKEPKKQAVKVAPHVKKLWKAIASSDAASLAALLQASAGQAASAGEGAAAAEGAGAGEGAAAAAAAACNAADPADGDTALHKAARANQHEMVTLILTMGGDPCIKNHQLQTAYAASPQETRLAFRLFQASNPDKYNYAKSQIPGPLTPELLEQERERKAAQKRAKRQKEKEKVAEKIKTNKFLQMKDADKVKAGEVRCFLCGAQLPKKPFEYESFKFCTIKCLQNHRNLRPLHMAA